MKSVCSDETKWTWNIKYIKLRADKNQVQSNQFHFNLKIEQIEPIANCQ